MTEIQHLSAAELLEQYQAKKLSPVEVAQDVLKRIERDNKVVNAFCMTYPDETLSMAKASEARWMRGEPSGALDGVPITIKDMLWQRGQPNRRGSLTTSDSAASDDSPAVARLRESGAVFVGRTTLSEFAWKGTTDSPLTGITRNPWDTRKTPGGSSGGAGAAGALNLGVLHIGTDAGGSIRIPASFSGIFGLKPSFGRVPTYPASAFALLSHVGPMTRTVRDAALMLNVMAQPDRRDLMAINSKPPDYLAGLDMGVKGLRIGWSVDLGYVDCLHAEVREIFLKSVDQFKSMGALVEEVSPGFKNPREAILTLWRAGCAAAFKGLRPDQHALVDPGFLRSAEHGLRLTATDYLAALDSRSMLLQQMHEFHDRYDVLLTPTVPFAAFATGQNKPDEQTSEEWLDWASYVYPFNLTQQPAASIPCGTTTAGLPVGMQIVGPSRDDAMVLRVARAFERVQPFTPIDLPLEMRSNSSAALATATR